MRTTPEQIGGIIDVDETISLTPFIAAANAMVTQHCAPFDYAEIQLAEIEMWLSAHTYTVRDMLPASEKAGSVSINYQHAIGQNLASSHYGQTAMLLDYHGGLAALSKSVEEGKRNRIVFKHLG